MPPRHGATGQVRLHMSPGSAGIVVFEKFIRYASLAVGLKPSATGCEARLRGRCRIISSQTLSPQLRDAKPARAGDAGLFLRRP